MRVVVRLKTSPERKLTAGHRPNRGQALFVALVLAGVGLACFGICLWRWCYDLELVAFFPLHQGGLSRWQVWFGLGLGLHLAASPLVSYAVGGSQPDSFVRRFQFPDRRAH